MWRRVAAECNARQINNAESQTRLLSLLRWRSAVQLAAVQAVPVRSSESSGASSIDGTNFPLIYLPQVIINCCLLWSLLAVCSAAAACSMQCGFGVAGRPKNRRTRQIGRLVLVWFSFASSSSAQLWSCCDAVSRGAKQASRSLLLLGTSWDLRFGWCCCGGQLG